MTDDWITCSKQNLLKEPIHMAFYSLCVLFLLLVPFYLVLFFFIATQCQGLDTSWGI